MKGLTEKQLKVYDFMSAWQEENGYPPTQTEIRDHFGFRSINAARGHLFPQNDNVLN